MKHYAVVTNNGDSVEVRAAYYDIYRDGSLMFTRYSADGVTCSVAACFAAGWWRSFREKDADA